MILRATIVPPAGVDEPNRHLEVVCGSFEQGRAELDNLTPDGWRRTRIVTGRPGDTTG